jgi:hypothetical protein
MARTEMSASDDDCIASRRFLPDAWALRYRPRSSGRWGGNPRSGLHGPSSCVPTGPAVARSATGSSQCAAQGCVTRIVSLLVTTSEAS